MNVSGDWEAAVALRVRNAPQGIVLQALRDALRRACRETCRWTAVLQADVPADCAGTSGLALTLAKPPAGCSAIRLMAVDWKRGGKRQCHARKDFCFAKTAKDLVLIDRWGWVQGGDVLEALVALEPDSTGYSLDEVPEDVATDLFAMVAAGAAATLLSMPNAPWANAVAAQKAAWEAQRELGIATSRMHGDFEVGSRITGVIDV